LTASSSSELAWTGLTGTKWKISGSLVLPATNAVLPYIQVGHGSTPTYQTTGYYAGGRFTGCTTTFAANSQWSNAGGYSVADTVSNASQGINFECEIFSLGSGLVHFTSRAVWRNIDTHTYMAPFGGVVSTTLPTTAIKFFFGSGAIASGTLSLYKMTE
jgi:hypothetical protein